MLKREDVLKQLGRELTQEERQKLAESGNPNLDIPFVMPTSLECQLVKDISPLGCPLHLGCSCCDDLDSYICPHTTRQVNLN